MIHVHTNTNSFIVTDPDTGASFSGTTRADAEAKAMAYKNKLQATSEPAVMPNCPVCGEHGSVFDSHIPERGSHFCASTSYGCGDWFTPQAPYQLHEELPATPSAYRTLSEAFLRGMDEIGIYGDDKYKEESVHAKFGHGDFSRSDRTKSREIAKHSAGHFDDYLDGVMHDKFNTREHNLFAVAFNAMMEYMFYKQDGK